MARVTTMSDAELNAFIAADSSRQEWRDSLYEVIVTDVISRNSFHPGEDFNCAAFPVSHVTDGGLAWRTANDCWYGVPLVLRTQTINNQDIVEILYRPPYPQAMCIGAFVRLWFGGAWFVDGAGFAPSNRQDLMQSNAPGCAYLVSERENGFGDVVTGNSILDNNDSRHSPGEMFLLRAPSEKFGLVADAETGRTSIFFDTIVTHLDCAIYATLHLVYAMDPAKSGSPIADWLTIDDDLPIVATEATTSMRASVQTMFNSYNYRHKLALQLTTPKANGLLPDVFYPYDNTIQGHNVNVFPVSMLRAWFETSYPNTRVIHGVLQLYTYHASIDRCINPTDAKGNPVPMETPFEFVLPATAEFQPTAAALTTSVIPNGFPVTTRYVQGISGVRVKMGKPGTKLNATIKRMTVVYYKGSATATQAAADGSYTVDLPPMDAVGDITLQAYVEDSRGMTSEMQTATITVLPYHEPEMTSCSLYRADQNGTPNEFGNYGVITVSAYTSPLDGANKVESVKAAILPFEPNMDWSGAADIACEAGVEKVLSGTVLDPSTIYRVRIQITDTTGQTITRYRFLKTAAYTFHLRQGGNGVGFGVAAWQEKTVALADDWDLTVYGQELLDLIVPIGCVRLFARVEGEADADPEELYPGTVWERVTDRFLMASSNPDSAYRRHIAGETGGSDSFTLRAENIPQLEVIHRYGGYAFNSGIATPPNTGYGFGGLDQAWDSDGLGIGEFGGPNYLDGAYANKGNTAPIPVVHTPPYYTVDVWVRKA